MEFLSYIHYTTPPEKVTPLPYVVPTYCEYWSRSQFHPITDDRASNANCRRQLETWAKLAHQATVYSYYADDTMKRFLYNPVPDVVLIRSAILQGHRNRGQFSANDVSAELVVERPAHVRLRKSHLGCRGHA